MTDREQRIREHAYMLWENEGRPEREADRHWRIAESQLAAQEAVVQPLSADAQSADNPTDKGVDAERSSNAPPELRD